MPSDIAIGDTLISLRGITKVFGEGATAFWMNPKDTAAYRAADAQKLAPVIKASGAKVE